MLVTICLSVWQFNRGIEKLSERDEFESRLSQPTIDFHQLHQEDSLYRHVELRGSLDQQRMFLVEGQQFQGEAGYWVISILNTDQGRFLVNRGWIPLAGNVYNDPIVETPIHPISIHGVVWPKMRRGSGTTKISSEIEWPARIRELDIDVMAARIGAYAKEIRLVEGSPGTFVPAPLEVSFDTAMHWGYSFQWILIGTLIVAGYWYFVIRPQNDKETS